MDGEKERWSGALIPSIIKIQQARHSSLTLSTDALQYLNRLLTRLLTSLLNPPPKNLQEAQEHLSRKFPEPLLTYVLDESRHARDKGRKKVHLSVDKVHHIVKDQSSNSSDKQVSVFYAAVLEYMLMDILKLTANYLQNISLSRKEISDQDVKIAMFADKVLVNIFQGDEAEDDIPLLPITTNDEIGDTSYTTLVRNLLCEEQRYLRDLQLIIKLIKKVFTDRSDLFMEADIDLIFGNIEDIAELSTKLIVMLEEALEMTDESNPIPLVGNCFEELAEECSFELYSDYTLHFTHEQWIGRFRAILQQANINSALKTVCEGFRDVVTYVLPSLLLAPIYHGFYYFEQIQLLQQNSADEDDKECFSQADSAIAPLKPILESRAATLPKNRPSESSLRISWKGGEQAEKMRQIEDSIEGWVGKTILQTCNEFIYEGDLTRITGKRSSERRVFLLDALLVCCKSNQSRRPMPAVATHEYRLKERILLRKTTVMDDETNDVQFIVIDGENRHLFAAPTRAEKHVWMTHLVRFQYRSTFDRMLDQLMRKEALQQPLRLPSPELYRFAEPDSPDNLVLEEGEGQIPSIKGGTVFKLVERLTYHLYYAASFTKTFLTTFRSFCKPHRFLDLLIERFDIPEPPPTEEQQLAIERGEIPTREDVKRFRKEYAQPIQLRVMNVIRQWLEYHWYDFENDPELLQRVRNFVATVRGKNMQKWARTMQKIIAKKMYCEEDIPRPSFAEDPPPVEWHLTHDKSKYTIMSLHPIEIARQLTLHEFSLYRKVQPSELVGTVWTKAGKEENSPNLLRMIHFSNTITRWVTWSILEMKNIEDRTAVMSRTIEIMQVLKRFNNFNGLLEFNAAFNASAIHRLNFTKARLPDRLVKELNECMDLCEARLKKVLDKLRSCDPPCVPFVGTFLTDILKTEEGNPHLLPNYPEHLELINFGKRRMVASIMLEIQQYQNQPYNFLPVHEIQDFITGLDPLNGMTAKQFQEMTYETSLEVEPRHAEKAAHFSRLLSDKELKSPGTVPSKRTTKALNREESRMSLFERRNSVQEEETVPATAIPATPEEPVTPVETGPPPPPRPPRNPIHDLVSAPPIMAPGKRSNIFRFDKDTLRKGASVDVADIPPPVPPRDNHPFLQSQFVPQPESGFFHNQSMFDYHHPVDQFRSTDPPYMIPEPLGDMEFSPQIEPAPIEYPTEPSFFERTVRPAPIVDNAPPPIPPRDPPVVPPRDPATMGAFEGYGSNRYVPDPTRFVSPSPSVPYTPRTPEIPPPVPRRQPSNAL